MFLTISSFFVIDDNTIKASIKFAKFEKIEPLTLAWMLTIVQCLLGLPLNPSSPFVSPHVGYFFFFFSPF